MLKKNGKVYYKGVHTLVECIFCYLSYVTGHRLNTTIEGKGKVVPVLIYVPRHEDVLGSGGIAPRIL